MINFIKNFFKRRNSNIPEINTPIPVSCKTCRFNNKEKDRCEAGDYWAEKFQNKICYEGELWQANALITIKQFMYINNNLNFKQCK